MNAQQTSKGKTVSKADRLAQGNRLVAAASAAGQIGPPTASLVPVKKGKDTVVHFKGTDAPTACGNWNPKATITPDAKLVTCKTCLVAMNPKTTKKSHEKKPDVTITCADCGVKRVVPASQAKTVTRCLECQKKAIKAKRKAKAKVRKANKGQGLKDRAEDLLGILLETDEDLTGEDLRALATLIYKTYPKANKV